MKNSTLAVDAHAALGEGSIWDHRLKILYWLDIVGKRLYRYDSETGENKSTVLGQVTGTIVPRASVGLVAATEHGFHFIDPDSGAMAPIADPEADVPDNRFNDGKCDPAGRFWAGTLSNAGTPGAAALYRLDPDKQVHTMLSGVSNSNGIVWDRSKTHMYYIDTPTREVAAFDYNDADGSIDNRRTVVRVAKDDGFPDGMCIDTEDTLWVAHWGGWKVIRYDPSNGAKLEEISVPAAQVTSCAFGGAKLDRLFITTAAMGLSEADLTDQPQAGGLFVCEPGVSGAEACLFAG